MSRVGNTLGNILIGIPGGGLIVMGMLMFHALLASLLPDSGWLMLALLCLTAFITGLLARLLRPFHGFGTALVSGIVAACILFYLWQTAVPGSETRLVFGPLGMGAALLCSSAGGWLLPRMRRQKA